MLTSDILGAAGAAAAMLALSGAAMAQETLKIGLILPMTGPFASTGRQIEAAAKLYMQQKGDTVAGKKIQLIVKDDTGVADVTKRLAQELIVNDKVAVMAGFGLTPLALASAPLATQAKVPAVVMAAATATITEASPFIVRTSFTLPQATVPMADWAAQNGIKKVVTLVSDYGPGIDAEKAFTGAFTGQGRAGGEPAGAAREPRLLALPAEGGRRQARRAVRLRAFGRRRAVHEAVRRARPRQERHQADRPRRRDR